MRKYYKQLKETALKLNSNCYIMISSQFARFIIMSLLSTLLIGMISNITINDLANTNLKNYTALEIIENNLREVSIKEKNLEINNQKQKNAIIELESKVAELEQDNYKLLHPQKVYNYTSEELEWLAKLVYHEAGSDDCTDEHQRLVASVVLCRVESPTYPNTIKEVISQQNPRQYGCFGTNDWYNEAITQRAYDNALAVLNGEYDYPKNLVYQSSFRQKDWGAKEYQIYKTFYTPSTGTTTFFCLGK